VKIKDDNLTSVLLPILLSIIAIFVLVWVEINNLERENLELKNDLNFLESKVRIMEEVDDKIYVHLETLGGNDLMLQSWIEEINCYLYECRYEWSSDYE